MAEFYCEDKAALMDYLDYILLYAQHIWARHIGYALCCIQHIWPIILVLDQVVL